MTKIVTFLSAVSFKVWLGICAALLACLPLTYCKGKTDGKTQEIERQLKAEIEAQKAARKADDNTATRREQDNQTNQENEDARNNAIERGGRIELNCERLRRAGYLDTDIPTECGS